jgi:hypothetical protein
MAVETIEFIHSPDSPESTHQYIKRYLKLNLHRQHKYLVPLQRLLGAAHDKRGIQNKMEEACFYINHHNCSIDEYVRMLLKDSPTVWVKYTNDCDDCLQKL